MRLGRLVRAWFECLLLYVPKPGVVFGALSVEELHDWPLLQLARGPIKLGSLAVFVDHSLIRRCRWYRALLVLIRGLRDGLDNKGRWFLGICKLLRLGADTQDLYIGIVTFSMTSNCYALL